MSCITQTQQPVRFIVSMGALPEGFCGTPQELAQAIADRLIIQADPFSSSFATGSVAPTSNVGPWLKDCETWYTWDDATGGYVPMQFPSIQNLAIPAGAILSWGGVIANIPDGWFLCNGQELLRQNYPNLYTAIGDMYGAASCAEGFKLPDLRNYFVVGAQQDDANLPKSIVGDGASLLHTRPYTQHTHQVTVPYLRQDGTNDGGGNGTVTSSVENVRVLPPFVALAYIIKS